MKQLKFWMLAFTLLVGTSLTSCMGEGDPTVTNVSFGQVTSFIPTTITTFYGVKVNAINDLSGQSLYPGDFVYFQYSYNSDEVEQNATTIDATIVIGEKMTYSEAVVDADKGEEYENVTILQIGGGPDSNFKFYYYDKNKVIIPALFLAKEDKSKHTFTLVYDTENVKAGDTEIKFYLRHNSQETGATTQAGSYKIFGIEEALEHFTSTAGTKPTKLTIYANETKDMTSDSLEKKKDELTAYSLEYSFKD